MDTKIFIDNETEAYMDHIFSQIFPDCSKEEVAQWLRSSPANTVLRVELVVLDPLQLKFDVDFLLEQNDAFVISAFLNGPTPASFCFFTVKL